MRQVFRKTLLPTYDVFDEDRYFEPAGGPQVLAWDGLRLRHLGLRGRLERPRLLAAAALPQRPGRRPRGRRRLVRAQPLGLALQHRQAAAPRGHARRHRPQVRRAGDLRQPGGRRRRARLRRPQLRLRRRRRLVARAAAFAPDVLVVELDELARGRRGAGDAARSAAPSMPATARARQAPGLPPPAPAALGPPTTSRPPPRCGARSCSACATTSHKSGFRRVLLGLSGGIDSALVAAVAAEALGPDNVLAVLMPSPYSSAGSVSDAQALADGLGIAHGDAAHRRPHGRLRHGPGARVRRPRRRASPKRTSRRASAATCSWRCPTSSTRCCSPRATSRSSRWATARSTATCRAGSRSSRTCPRPWSTRWRAG